MGQCRSMSVIGGRFERDVGQTPNIKSTAPLTGGCRYGTAN
jgi:hypothetical protein